jgi:putative DNA primase/helicase
MSLDLRAAARRLAGEISGRNQVSCPGVNHSVRDRSLAVRFDPNAPEGFVVHSFAGDDPIQARDYVREKLGLPEWQPGDGRDRRIRRSTLRDFDRMAIDREAGPRPCTEDDLARIAMATRMWDQAQELRGTTAERYLKSRALELPTELAGTVLRFHPRCPWRNENTGKTERIPAMLAAFRSIDDNAITGVHRIRLDQPDRWPKADRRMLGIVHHAAVKLDPIKDSTLVIGEGVETCLAARQLELSPVWALGSVGAISFFPLLRGVRRLMILGEAGEPSQQAIKLCTQRWQRAGRRVQIAYSEIGADMNDALMSEKIAQ